MFALYYLKYYFYNVVMKQRKTTKQMTKYIATLKHDKGTVKISVLASDIETAKILILKAENCPESAIKSIKANKYITVYVVQGSYGHGWEDLTSSEDYSEARANLKDYRNNDNAPTRLITRKVVNK